MRFTLDIAYPAEKVEQNRRPLVAAACGYADRVPVGFCLAPCGPWPL